MISIKTLLIASSILIITLLDADTKMDTLIPIRFHIVSNLSMTQKGVQMESWVTKDNIKQTIIPELNRIWEPSGIAFEVEKIFITPALDAITSTRSLIK